MDALTKHKEGAPREMRKTKDTTFDRIFKYYHNKRTTVTLTEAEDLVRQRLDFAWKCLCEINTRQGVVDLMLAKFPTIKKSIAFDDINKAMAIFGDPRAANKEAKRALSEGWIVQGIKKAWEDGDLAAYERLLARYNKINRLEDDDGGLGDKLKAFKAVQINITADRGDLQKLAQDMQQRLAQTIEFEQIDNAGQEADQE
jgi:hypothetical protein